MTSLLIGTVLGLLAGAQVAANTGSVAGRIVEAGSLTPIEGAQVFLNPMLGSDFGPARQTVSDADGMFAVEGLSFGRYLVSVYKPGFAIDRSVEHRPQVLLTAGDPTARPVYELQPAARLEGRVLNPAGGAARALVTAWVEVTPGEWEDAGLGGFTDERGNFLVKDLRAGDIRLRAQPLPDEPSAPSARSVLITSYYRGAGDPTGPRNISVQPRQRIEGLVITLETAPAYEVRGVLLDDAGRPVANGLVSLKTTTLENDWAWVGGYVRTAADGQFMFRGAVSGEYWINAAAPIYSRDPDGSNRNTSRTQTLPSGDIIRSNTQGGNRTEHRFEAARERQIVVSDRDLIDVRLTATRPH